MSTSLIIPPQDAAPAEVFGALREGLHLAGYSFERAVRKLDYLLTNDRWQQCGEFEGDVNKFLAGVSLADFKPTIDQRKSIVRKLAKIEASQRAIAKIVGVDEKTVRRDVAAANAAPTPDKPNEIKASDQPSAANAAPAQGKPNETKALDPSSDSNESPPPPNPDSGIEAATLLTSRKAPRAAAHDGNDEWYTPPDVIEVARDCMGGIDLDPASTAKANETVQAKAIYTVEDDGLIQPWHGRVFLNPPFSAQLKRAFCDRLRESVASGDVTQAVLVTPIDYSPQWGDVIRTCASAVAHAVGSTPFYGPRGEHGGPGFGHMVSYYGPNVERFASVFGREWSVWVRPTEHAEPANENP